MPPEHPPDAQARPAPPGVARVDPHAVYNLSAAGDLLAALGLAPS
jgi:hypothetical protein